MHSEQHTELDNLITMQSNLRNSAKGSNDAHDVHTSLTQGAWDHIADEMLLEFAESGHPTFRATTPLSRVILKSKAQGKLSIHFTADYPTIETVFRIHYFCQSAQYLRISGELYVKNLKLIKIDRGEPDVLMGQSIVLGEIKAEIPLQNEDSMNDQIIWQRYIHKSSNFMATAHGTNRITFTRKHRVSRFCMETGFIRVVEVGQYFMTNDTGVFRQFRSVACREYTLHLETIQHQKQKDGSKAI